MRTEKIRRTLGPGRIVLAVALTALVASSAAAVTVDVSLVDVPDRHLYADFNYTLTDAESDPATVLIEYSLNGTDFTELYTLTGKATSPGGTPYTFRWFTLNWDDVKAVDSTVWLRMTATDDDGSSSDTVGPFPIYNRPYVEVLSVVAVGPDGWNGDGSPSTLLVRGEPVRIGAGLQCAQSTVVLAGGHAARRDYRRPTSTGTTWASTVDSRSGTSAIEDFEHRSATANGTLPADFPVADSYTLTVSGGASRLDWGPVSVPVEVLRAGRRRCESRRQTAARSGSVGRRTR